MYNNYPHKFNILGQEKVQQVSLQYHDSIHLQKVSHPLSTVH